MAYIKPGTLRISPPNPTDADHLSFTFTGSLDWVDTLPVLGFDTIFHILFKKTGTMVWDVLVDWKCANCFNNLCPTFAWGTVGCDFTLEVDRVLPMGQYDFMVIDDGDYKAKTPPYDMSRTTVRNGVMITPYSDPNQPTLEISVTQLTATITINGALAGHGTVGGYPAKLGSSAQIVVSHTGYTTVYKSVLIVPGRNIVPLITLDICGASDPGCYPPPINGNGDGECDGMNRDGSLDPMCILEPGNEMYLYGAIGLIVVILLMGGKKN